MELEGVVERITMGLSRSFRGSISAHHSFGLRPSTFDFRSRGFVLIEVMVAVAIFALAVLALGQGVRNCIAAQVAREDDARAQRILENRMAEIELGVMTRQCLSGRRTPDRASLASHVRAWVARRNRLRRRVDWRFATADARIKLKRLYPSIEP